MKLKQITLASSLFFSSYLVIGATYDLPDEQQLNFPSQNLTSTPDGEIDNGFFDLETPATQVRSDQLKQEYLAALKLLKQHKLKAAEKEINHLIQQNPKEADFYNLQAALKILQKQPKLAIESYQKAIKLAPESFKAHLGLATIFLRENDLTEAKKYANSALSINKKFPHTYILLSEIAFQENKPQDTESLLLTAQTKARGSSKLETMVAARLAKFYTLQKQPKKVLAVAQDISNRYPGNSSALAILASAQIINNQPKLAIPTLERLTNQESKDIRHRLILAKLLSNQGKTQKVLDLLSEINAIAPDNTQLLVQETIILTQLKLFPEALKVSKKVKQLTPDLGLAETLEGNIYLAENKLGPALTAYQKSYKIKPNTKVLKIITKILLAQERQTDAINFLSQELKKNPENLTAHFHLGNIYQQQNNIRAAEKHYLAILAEQPDNVVILNNLAWIYQQLNNPKALALAKKAYTKAPQSADIADTYATILIKQGDLAEGLKILEKASKQAPQNYDIQYHLADAYAINGQTRQAVQILETITRSKQKFSEKDAALSLLEKLSTL